MKKTLLAVLFCWFVLPALAQNKQWLRNIDGTVSRVCNLYYGETPDIFYSLVWHRDFIGPINNGLNYYRLNKFKNDSLIQTEELFKMNKMVHHNNRLLNNKIDKHTIMSIESLTGDTLDNYIVYFNDTLQIDSHYIHSPIPITRISSYLKQKDSLIIIHGDDIYYGGNVYVLFTDSQGTYLSHKRIPHENNIPSPVFNEIYMWPRNMIADGKGGYIVVGTRDSIGRNIKKHMFGLSPQGDKTWEYFEPMDGNSLLADAKLLPDGTILTWGMQWERMYIGRFTNTGVPIWQKMYHPGDISDIAYPAYITDIQIIDGYMYAGGASSPNSRGTNQYGLLMKLTMEGDVLWMKGFGNYYYNNILEHMLFVGPNKFMLGGFCVDSTLSPVHGVSWYVSTDTAANEELPWCKLLPFHTLDYTSLHSVPNPECSTCVRVYPNPATNGILQIEIEPEYLDDAHIILYTMTGIPVHKQAILNNQEVIQIGHLAAGNYLLWFKSNRGSATKKVIIR
jgi:hypothetical protein